jgi:hypothetical protein
MILVSVKGTPLQMQEQTENDIRTLLLAGWLSQLLVNKIDSIAACFLKKKKKKKNLLVVPCCTLR